MKIFLDVFVDVVFRKFAKFTGRSGRNEYWIYCLAQFVLFDCLTVLLHQFGVDLYDSTTGNGSLVAILFILILVLSIPMLALTIRRLHDLNQSGWWVLTYFLAASLLFTSAEGEKERQLGLEVLFSFGRSAENVSDLAPVLGLVFFVYTLFPGTVGPNRYGDEPEGIPGLIGHEPPQPMVRRAPLVKAYDDESESNPDLSAQPEVKRGSFVKRG